MGLYCMDRPKIILIRFVIKAKVEKHVRYRITGMSNSVDPSCSSEKCVSLDITCVAPLSDLFFRGSRFLKEYLDLCRIRAT